MDFRVKYFKELPSTNSYLLDLPPQKVKEGLVIVANYQTQGRGKPGREWLSPRGENLLFSILLKPPVPPSKAPLLTQIACRSVAAVLEMHGINSTFKRPNDILVQGKKICGILVETGTSGRKLEYAILGIGLNINAIPPGFYGQSTSMKAIKGIIFGKKTILKKILDQLKKDLESFYAASSA